MLRFKKEVCVDIEEEQAYMQDNTGQEYMEYVK